MSGEVVRIPRGDDEPGRTTTFMAVVLTVLVLIAGSWTLLYVLIGPHTNEPDEGDTGAEPHPWEVPAEPMELRQDEHWTEESSGMLASPITVKDGARLRLEDCRIRVPLTDLLFWRRPAFSVEGGGTMVVENATIEIVRDPFLDVAVMGPLEPERSGRPYIARPANLVGARDPVLGLDAWWLFGDVEVTVGVLPEGGDAIQVIGTFHVPEGSFPMADHIETSLAAYKGTVPWVVVFVSQWPEGLVLLGNATVVDGEGPPPGDMFPTGDPVLDGWETGGFQRLNEVLTSKYVFRDRVPDGNATWQGLIEANGTVRISGSQILAPRDLGRWMNDNHIKEERDPGRAMPMDLVATHGGHISSSGSRLTVRDSVVENVPVIARDGELSMEHCQVSGDCDLVSLHNADASIARVTFSGRTGTWKQLGREHQDRHLWALAAEHTSGARVVDLENCTFEGFSQALDLNHVQATMRGCTFRDIGSLAIWDHETVGWSWGDLKGNNSFEGALDNLYYRTETTEVVFTHPGIPAEDLELSASMGVWTDLAISSRYTSHAGFPLGNRAWYVAPAMLVDEEEGERACDQARASVNFGGHQLRYDFAPGTDRLSRDLARMAEEKLDPEPEVALEVWSVTVEEGDGPINCTFYIWVHGLHGIPADNVTMGFAMDEVDLVELDLEGHAVPIDDGAYVRQRVQLPTGWHLLSVSLWGNPMLEGGGASEEVDEVTRLDVDLLVPDQGMDVGSRHPLEADYIIVDEGLGVTLPPLEPPAGEGPEHSVTLVGNASVVTIDASGIPPSHSLSIGIVGNLSVDLANGFLLDLRIGDGEGYWSEPWSTGHRHCRVSVRNVTCHHLWVMARGRDVRVMGVRTSYSCDIDVYHASYTLVAGCSFSHHGLELWSWHSNQTIKGCAFASEWSVGMVAYLHGGGSLVVDDCAFSGSYLAVFLPGMTTPQPDRVDVTGCTFSGEGAVLYVGSDIVHVDQYDDDPGWVPPVDGTMAGNVFEGPGNHVVLHHGLCARMWGDNDMDDGARLYAMYIARLQVIPPDTTPSFGAYRFIPVAGTVTDWPLPIHRWIPLDGELLHDVTDVPSREADPPELDVLLLSTGYGHMIVRGFGTVDPMADNDEATYPARPDLSQLLLDLAGEWERS